MVYKVFGYKVYKEDDIPFGYDKENNTLVPNEIEAEIVKYAYDSSLDAAKEMSEYPSEWIEYLSQKNEECEELLKRGMFKAIPVGNPENFKTSEIKPIIDIETWSKVWEKLSQENIGEPENEIKM